MANYLLQNWRPLYISTLLGLSYSSTIFPFIIAARWVEVEFSVGVAQLSVEWPSVSMMTCQIPHSTLFNCLKYEYRNNPVVQQLEALNYSRLLLDPFWAHGRQSFFVMCTSCCILNRRNDASLCQIYVVELDAWVTSNSVTHTACHRGINLEHTFAVLCPLPLIPIGYHRSQTKIMK